MGTCFLKAAQTAPVPGSSLLAWPASERGSLWPQAFSLNAKAVSFWPAQLSGVHTDVPNLSTPQSLGSSAWSTKPLSQLSPSLASGSSGHIQTTQMCPTPSSQSTSPHDTTNHGIPEAEIHAPSQLPPAHSFTKPASCLCFKPPRLLPLLFLLCISLRALEHKPSGHHSPPSYLPPSTGPYQLSLDTHTVHPRGHHYN